MSGKCKNKIDLDSATAGSLMTTDVTTISPNETVHYAMELMVEERLSALPVVNRLGVCIGMLSRADMLEMLIEVDARFANLTESPFSRLTDHPGGFTTQVGALMTDTPISIDTESPIGRAAELMSLHHIHHLPVVDSQGLLLGIISSMDIANAVARVYGEKGCCCPKK